MPRKHRFCRAAGDRGGRAGPRSAVARLAPGATRPAEAGSLYSGTRLTDNASLMRHQSSITSLSWIPSEAIEGSQRLAFDAGMAHYDDPPPEVIEDLEALRAADRFRFANELTAWVEVDDAGQIRDFGQGGGGLMGSTTVRVGPVARTFEAVGLPDIVPKPSRRRRLGSASPRRSAVAPACPRRVACAGARWCSGRRRCMWTTLSLTLHAEEQAKGEMTGHSRFPRHWVFGADGQPDAQVRPGRLQGLVPQVVRTPHTVGGHRLARHS